MSIFQGIQNLLFRNQKPILRKEVQNRLIFEIKRSTKSSLTVWIDVFQLFLNLNFHWRSQHRLQIMESAVISILIQMLLNMNPIEESRHGLDIYQTEFSGRPQFLFRYQQISYLRRVPIKIWSAELCLSTLKKAVGQHSQQQM